MAKDEILEKLTRFLAEHRPISEECHAVYIMVELRKLLDRLDGNPPYRTVRFYADWTVHTRKDRNTEVIEDTMRKMYAAILSATRGVRGPAKEIAAVRHFVQMIPLRDEISELLARQGVSDCLTKSDHDWLAFARPLVKVLQDQPIWLSGGDIESFSFTPASDGTSMAVIDLRQSVAGQRRHAYTIAF